MKLTELYMVGFAQKEIKNRGPMKKYTLIYWKDGRWFVGRLRERSDVFSQGETLRELEGNIKDALKMMESTDFENLPPGYKVKDMTIEA